MATRSIYPNNSRQHEDDDCAAIFVHAGAGFHSIPNEPSHLAACAAACKAAMVLLRNGGSAVDGVEMALKSLEDNEITNSGYGSNLSLDGTVECDASIMEESGRSGAVGAADRFKNPSALARLILENARQPMSLKRVPPVFLVGPGANSYALEHSFPLVNNQLLVSNSAHARWVKWKRELDGANSRAYSDQTKQNQLQSAEGQSGVPLNPASKSDSDKNLTRTLTKQDDHVTDTVGAICVDRWGNVAAGSSSGGIGMKHRGRVGPAALVGVGTWIKAEDDIAVAATCSGTGEQMAHTLIASKAVDRMFYTEDELDGMQKCIERDFMGSTAVKESKMTAAVGIMGVKVDRGSKPKRIHFLYGHTTDSMALAHMTSAMREPETVMSRNKRNPKTCLGGKLVPNGCRR
ncbi:hypothetical protein RUND412_000837 [Rhizina undulata]